jgi:hypothetical protein
VCTECQYKKRNILLKTELPVVHLITPGNKRRDPENTLFSVCYRKKEIMFDASRLPKGNLAYPRRLLPGVYRLEKWLSRLKNKKVLLFIK